MTDFASPDARPLLAARGLVKRFGAVVAAEDITIEVPAGQRLSVIGSNGAGKTTFVNMVTGYLRPDEGSILLDGVDISSMGHQQISRMGICRSFQIPQLFLDLTLRENLLVAVSSVTARPSLWREAAQADAAERTENLISRFRMRKDASRPVRELAGGVRKLVDIAMALGRKPRLLLLDEPTSGVSAHEKFDTMEKVMEALRGEAASVIFVEHDMEIVQRFSERVVAFYNGRVIADGSAAAVLESGDVQRYVTGKKIRKEAA
ncbi:MAG: ABC transporter ATP-binding protein [Proteobacteria bacterium]|nr:ABC transporter ATP-binding protein [Pseudomonadota bacterium]